MSKAVAILNKKSKKTTVDDELEATTKVKSKSKADKPAKKSKDKKSEKVKAVTSDDTTEGEAEAAVPSVAEIKEMKSKALEKLHATLPEALDGWEALSNKEKRKALIEALHDEVPEEKSKKKKASDEDEEEVTVKKQRKVDINSKSAIERAIAEVQALDESELHSTIIKLLEEGDMNDFKLGGMLASIDASKFYGEYESFRDFVEAELQIGYRKARYLIEIYNDVVESDVPFKKLDKIGWTKLKEVSKIINSENVDEWVEKAGSMNTLTLAEEVKNYMRGDVSDVSKKTTSNDIATLSFKLHKEQRENVEAAIDKALEEGGTDSKAVAVEYMALEYLAGGKKKPPTMKEVFANLKKKHGDDDNAAYDEMRKIWNKQFPDVELS